MSKESIVTKKLISLCKDKPYLLKGAEEDYDYLETAKSQPAFFIVDKDLIYSYEFLRIFWSKEIRSTVSMSADHIVELNEVIKKGTASFSKTYKSIHPNVEGQLFKNKSLTQDIIHEVAIDEFVNCPPEEILKYKSIRNFVKDRILNHLEDISCENAYGKDILRIKVDVDKHKKILNVVSVLVEKLTYNPTSFTDSVILEKQNKPGIYAIIYDGNDFPLYEASEYVKLRPIIYIDKTKNINKDLSMIINGEGLGINKFLTAISNTLIYSKTVDIKAAKKKEIKKDIRKWLVDNLKYSFLLFPNQKVGKKDYELLQENYKLLLENKAPIFNLENDANIFSTKLKSIQSNKFYYTETHGTGGRGGGRL